MAKYKPVIVSRELFVNEYDKQIDKHSAQIQIVIYRDSIDIAFSIYHEDIIIKNVSFISSIKASVECIFYKLTQRYCPELRIYRDTIDNASYDPNLLQSKYNLLQKGVYANYYDDVDEFYSGYFEIKDKCINFHLDR